MIHERLVIIVSFECHGVHIVSFVIHKSVDLEYL